MSDATQASEAATIATIVAGAVVQVVTTVSGLLILWIKVKYGVDKATEAAAKADAAGQKIDENTSITTQVKAAADKASEHVEGCDQRMQHLHDRLADHDRRIGGLESKMGEVMAATNNLNDNLKSTRHEMRNSLQSVVNKLDLMMLTTTTNAAAAKKEQPPPPPPPTTNNDPR